MMSARVSIATRYFVLGVVMAIVAGAAIALVTVSVSTPVEAQVNREPQIAIIWDGFSETILKGTGFTITRSAAGLYQIDFPPRTFTPPSQPNDFSTFPVVIVTAVGGGDTIANSNGVGVGADGSGFAVISVKDPDGTLKDAPLHILVTK